MENDFYNSILESIEKLSFKNKVKLLRKMEKNLNTTRSMFYCDICDNFIEDTFIEIHTCTRCSCTFCNDCHTKNGDRTFCHECGVVFCKKCEDKMTNLFYCSPECAKKVISRLVPNAVY